MMDYKSALEAIVNIEREVDVNAIQIHSTQVWPLIRMSLWYQMMNQEENHIHLDGKEHSYRYTPTSQTLSAITQRAQAGSTDLILFSSSAYYTDKAGDAFYNRHVDPFSDLFGKIFSIQNMELNDAKSHVTHPRKHPSLILSFTEERKEILNRKTSIPEFAALREAILNLVGFDMDIRLVMENLRRLRAYRAFFSQILTQLNPRAVGIICYYHLPAMGLTWACRTRGVPCLEIQHGKQGKYHGMYTHWTVSPPEGYELVPTHFWTWGEESRENIAKWLPPKCDTPRVEVLGSPWLSLWLEGPGCEPARGTLDRLTARITDRQVILFSMQPLKENPLPPFLLEAIRHSPSSWLWFMRLHPRDVDQVDRWADFFFKNSMENVEWHLANELPLFTLLKNSRHHVTCFSSVAFEALSFGRSTTIIHPSGKLLYDKYLHNGYFRYADNAQNIIRSVNVGIIEPHIQENSPYITHDKEKMKIKINNIIHSYHIKKFHDKTGEARCQL